MLAKKTDWIGTIKEDKKEKEREKGEESGRKACEKEKRTCRND